MKKIMKMFIMIVLMVISALMLFCISVEAANPNIQLVKSSELINGYSVMTIKINCEQDVGVIEGYIKKDDNISSIEVSQTYNSWTTTYNANTGKFNSFNPAGVKTGDIVQIKYKVKDNTKKSQISLTNIELTTIDYDTVKVSENVVTSIDAINNNNGQDKEPETNPNPDINKDENTGGNKVEESKNPESSSKPSTETKKESTSVGVDKTVTANKKLPKAGLEFYSIVVMAVLILLAILYNKFYRNLE